MRAFLFGLLVSGVLLPAQAAVVFTDDYQLRSHGQDIWGTLPTTSTAGVGAYGSVLTFPYSGKVDQFTPVGKVLKFDTSAGDDTQMAYVPFAYAYSNDRVLLSLRAAHPDNQPGFNNFAIGFASHSPGDGHLIFTDHILVQQGQIQLNLPGMGIPTTTVPFSSENYEFYEFELGYDPNLAGIAGAQPYSLAINDVSIAIPVNPDTVYTPLVGFDAVAFGGRFSGGLTTRFISDFSFEVFDVAQVPEPGSLALLAFGIALLGGARWPRRRRAAEASWQVCS